MISAPTIGIARGDKFAVHFSKRVYERLREPAARTPRRVYERLREPKKDLLRGSPREVCVICLCLLQGGVDEPARFLGRHRSAPYEALYVVAADLAQSIKLLLLLYALRYDLEAHYMSH